MWLSENCYRTPWEGAMDLFPVAFLVIPAAIAGGVLFMGVTALLQIRSCRHERQQMKRHIQSIDRIGATRAYIQGSIRPPISDYEVDRNHYHERPEQRYEVHRHILLRQPGLERPRAL
jgi:hypothetical protein